MLRRGLSLLFGLAAACTCQTYADRQTYACTQTTDCADPYTCVAGVCVLTGLGGGAAEGGGSANGGGAADGGGSATGGGSTTGGGSAGGAVGGGGAPMGGGMGTGGGDGADAGAVAVRFLGMPQTVIRGACSAPIYLDVVDAAQQHTRAAAPTPVQLGGSSPGSVTYYSDTACTVPVDQLMLAPAVDSVRFSFFADTQGTVTLTATAPGLAPGSQDATLLPVVRRGECVLTASQTTVSCPISPPQTDLGHSALIFQAAAPGATPDDSEVRCAFVDLATVECARVGAVTPVSIAWQTLEPASGLKVQHTSFMCQGQTSVSVPITPVDPSRAFVLMATTKGGATVGADDFATVDLTDAGEVTMQLGAGELCSVGVPMVGAVEVVEVSGAMLTRGAHAPLSMLTEVEPLATSASTSSSILLVSYRSSVASGAICGYMVRGASASPTSIVLSRGDDAGYCAMAAIEAVEYQRVDLGARASVQTLEVWMDAGVFTAVVTPKIQPEPERTLLLATGHGLNGCGSGETSGPNVALGEGSATFTFDGGGVQVTRGSATGTARFTAQIVQWNP